MRKIIFIAFVIFAGWGQISAQILTEDFENGFTRFVNDTANTVDFVLDSTLYHGGSKSAHNAYTANNTNILYQNSPVDLSGTTEPVLKFWHIAKTEGRYDKCYVEISTDGGQTFSVLPDSLYRGAASDYSNNHYFHEDSYSDWGTSSQTPSNNWWKQESFSLAAYKTTGVVIRFRLSSDGSVQRAGWYIDDIQILNITCPAPGNLTVMPTSSTEAVVTWDDNTATSWNLEYGPHGFTQGSGTQINGITTPTYTITGLSPKQIYDLYLTPDCGNNGTSETTSITWTQPAVDNQTCQTALELQVGTNDLSTAMLTDNTGATDSGIGSASCGRYEGGDVWFKAVVPVSGKIAFVTLKDSLNIDTAMALYVGSCDNLTQAQCDDDDGLGTRSKIEYTGTAGDTVYVRVWEYRNDNHGTFKIVALEPPANDNCETAVEVASFPFSQDAFSLGNFREPNVNGNDLNGLWYKFTVNQATDSILVSVTPDAESNSQITIYSGDCGNLSRVGSASTGGTGRQDTYKFMPSNNTTYYVNVAERVSYNPVKSFHIDITSNSTLAVSQIAISDLRFHPNPTTGIIRWNATGTIEYIQITNLAGQVLMDTEQPAGNTLDISRLPQGVYLLRVRMDGKDGVYRIIKE